MKWYNKPSMHEAIGSLKAISEKANVGMDDLSLRWLFYHSILEEGDGVILGASKVSQIGKNTAQIKKGPLDEGIVREVSELWEGVKDEGMEIIDYSRKS